MPAKVLVVDDELSLRLFIAAVYETNGFSVVTARNGAEGLQKARAQRFDLISLDLMMPGQGGLKMYRELAADPNLARIPVIVVSAVAGDTFGQAAKTLAASIGEELPPPGAYIEKPPDPEAIIAAAKRLLEGHPG